VKHDPSSSSDGAPVSTSAAVAVETVAGVLSGFTSALLTNPLDLVKTRLQVMLGSCSPLQHVPCLLSLLLKACQKRVRALYVAAVGYH